ncbi:hypothetical protein E3N88_29111 [Mikania micrantha]|uniref:Uncharacterized protein n=1 Tax=Mikania micrantha TaxID=192012 RepID=A0A5N6N2N0_9ASTR|nr:hypothetical protein E3N88_29111 [Mikania micrantha]
MDPRVNHDYNWVWLLPYLLRGKYDVALIYALWGKYGCSSTCYWVSMGAPVLVTGTRYWVSMDLQNASADQIKGYGALCRHKPTVTLGSSGCMMMMIRMFM